MSRSTIWAFILLILTASLYRVWDSRPYGFAPQVAMALFGGAVIRDKKLAFILPLFSLLLSDAIYEILFRAGVSDISGLYYDQWLIYTLFAGITLLGMLMKKINVARVIGFTIIGSVLFFLISNLAVWIGGYGLGRPHTFHGLLLCYGDALAFYRDYSGFAGIQLVGDLFFSGLLFGGHYLLSKVLFASPAKTTA